MNEVNSSTVQPTELKFIFKEQPLPLIAKTHKEPETTDVQNGKRDDDEVTKDKPNLDEHNNENIEITIWRSKKICIKRALIPLRVALFLWFGSGSLSAPFITVMMISRGLTLKEFSAVFSVVFLSQLISAYISGIVADKLGNAKPIMLFLMLCSTLAMAGIVLSPNVVEKSCLERDINTTCLDIYNYTLELEYCKYACSRNFTDNILIEDEDKNKIDFNVSDNSNGTDVLRNVKINRNALDSNDTIISCSKSCSCINQSDCSSTYNFGFKVIYFVLISVLFSFWSTTYRFLDFACLNVAKRYNSDFGKERIFGLLGSLASSILCNFILNIGKSEKKDYYDTIFWIALALQILSIISACYIRNVTLPPGIKLTEKTLKLFTNIEIMSFIFVVFVAGSAYTFNMFFQTLFLTKLNASKEVIVFHVMTYSVYGIPIYLTSKWWLRKLGTFKILIIGLLCYAVNGVCYSFLYHPWLSIIFEITKSLSFHLFWIASVIHSREIAPEGLAATLNAIVGTVHFGVGRSFSVSVGGYLISILEERATFRILSGYCLVTAVLYSMYVYLRHLYSKKGKREQNADPEEMKSMKENEA